MNRRNFIKSSSLYGAGLIFSYVSKAENSQLNPNYFKKSSFEVPKHNNWVEPLEYSSKTTKIFWGDQELSLLPETNTFITLSSRTSIS
jgi:hypothetical protein